MRSSEADGENVIEYGRCGATFWCGVSPVLDCGVELGHEFAVGGPGCGQILVAFFDLEAQVDELLLQVADLLVELIDAGCAAEPGFAPCLFAEFFG